MMVATDGGPELVAKVLRAFVAERERADQLAHAAVQLLEALDVDCEPRDWLAPVLYAADHLHDLLNAFYDRRSQEQVNVPWDVTA